MFIPSNEFQIIHPEQFVPPGLHLRMDLESGLKEGKLMEKSKGKDIINVPAVKISELPMEHSSLTVQEKKSLMQLLDDLDDPVSLLKNLEFLSEIVHDIDIGQELTGHQEGFLKVLSLLDHESHLIKQEVVSIIGNSVSNNPKAIDNVLKTDTIQSLVVILFSNNQDKRLIKKSFFALASLVRGLGSRFFEEYDGMSLLKRLYDENIQIRSSILILLSDLLNPDMMRKVYPKHALQLDRQEFLFWCSKIDSENIEYLESQFSQKCLKIN